jgi:hypothetical protein
MSTPPGRKADLSAALEMIASKSSIVRKKTWCGMTEPHHGHALRARLRVAPYQNINRLIKIFPSGSVDQFEIHISLRQLGPDKIHLPIPEVGRESEAIGVISR